MTDRSDFESAFGIHGLVLLILFICWLIRITSTIKRGQSQTTYRLLNLDHGGGGTKQALSNIYVILFLYSGENWV